jgi:hypothetical protein
MDNSASISVKRTGDYELLSVSDLVCEGNIAEGHRLFKVSEIERPGVSIPKVKQEGVCEGEAAFANVEFSGASPFSFEWTEGGRVNLEKIDGKSFRLPLPTRPGTHEIKVYRRWFNG